MTSNVWSENTRLRHALGQLITALQAYHDAPHFEIDGIEGDEWEVIVQPHVRTSASAALDLAQQALQGKAR